jgi:hypothetical protein
MVDNGAMSSSAHEAPGRFGRLERVELREYWRGEREFMPWLAMPEAVALLGESIGLGFDLVPGQPFLAARSGELDIVIENQLGDSDHEHFGRAMLHAAGLDAGLIIWIAGRFTDEYRKSIEWLNRKDGLSLVAVELELWRIGSSPIAPRFNVVCGPQESALRARSAAAAADRPGPVGPEFWMALADAMAARGSSFELPAADGEGTCELDIGTTRGYLRLAARREGNVSCEVHVTSAHADQLFSLLAEQRGTIEAGLGLDGRLRWQPHALQITLEDEIGPLGDPERWAEAHDWLLNWAERFRSVFAQRLEAIELPAEPFAV